ncbi:hypothetical protein CKA32_005270 [Geitlerinema sp. FC II]|nr:hypothetical protein CKA32_005270 [Geitlerinema sp. FC II]
MLGLFCPSDRGSAFARAFTDIAVRRRLRIVFRIDRYGMGFSADLFPQTI